MKFGILGDAKISREKLIPAIQTAGHEITHIGRRNPDAPSDDPLYAGMIQYGYDDVLANPDIEAVYIPLPNHLHVPWTIRAIEAGKHVLCEKPIALNKAELDRLEAVASASNVYVYEGFMIRHHPQWKWITEIDIGTPQAIQTHFCYPPRPAQDVRNVAEFGGGPIYDIGCYAIMAGVLMFGDAPEHISCHVEMDGDRGIEKLASGMLIWPQGRHLTFTVSSSSGLSQMVHVIGSDGWARLNIPFNPAGATTAQWGKGALGDDAERIEFPACDQYALMVADFVAHAKAGAASDFTHSRATTKTIDALLGARNR